MKLLPMVQIREDELRKKETKYGSHRDTARSSRVPKFIHGCEGSVLDDSGNQPYLNFPIWHWSVNAGYRKTAIIGHYQS